MGIATPPPSYFLLLTPFTTLKLILFFNLQKEAPEKLLLRGAGGLSRRREESKNKYILLEILDHYTSTKHTKYETLTSAEKREETESRIILSILSII